METQNEIKDVYIRKTYPWKTADKVPANYIKKWFASISKETKTPVTTQLVKWIHNFVGSIHCFRCVRLNDCCFNSSNMPEIPLHDRCHCYTESIPYNQVLAEAKSESDYSKFDPYLFNRDNKYTHGKEKLFEKWGYTIDDAKWLQAEIERQGREKYIAGNYVLGKLDLWGQRINITIEIQRKDTGGIVSFEAGWMLKPNGKIILNTPYGGK